MGLTSDTHLQHMGLMVKHPDALHHCKLLWLISHHFEKKYVVVNLLFYVMNYFLRARERYTGKTCFEITDYNDKHVKKCWLFTELPSQALQRAWHYIGMVSPLVQCAIFWFDNISEAGWWLMIFLWWCASSVKMLIVHRTVITSIVWNWKEDTHTSHSYMWMSPKSQLTT